MPNFAHMKKSGLLISILFFLAVLSAFNMNGTTSSSSRNIPASSLMTSNIIGEESYSHRSSLVSSIDIPLPLKGQSEQILYRKSTPARGDTPSAKASLARRPVGRASTSLP